VEGRFVHGRFVEGRFVEGRFVVVPAVVVLRRDETAAGQNHKYACVVKVDKGTYGWFGPQT
jgi:hypothetical protein